MATSETVNQGKRCIMCGKLAIAGDSECGFCGEPFNNDVNSSQKEPVLPQSIESNVNSEAELLPCPKCNFKNEDDLLSCKFCGVIFNKFYALREKSIKAEYQKLEAEYHEKQYEARQEALKKIKAIEKSQTEIAEDSDLYQKLSDQKQEINDNLQYENMKQDELKRNRLASLKHVQEQIVRLKNLEEKLTEKARLEELARQEEEEKIRIAQEKAKIERERLEAEQREREEAERLALQKKEEELARQKAEEEELARQRAQEEELARRRAQEEEMERQKAEEEKLARQKQEEEDLERQRRIEEKAEEAHQEEMAQKEKEEILTDKTDPQEANRGEENIQTPLEEALDEGGTLSHENVLEEIIEEDESVSANSFLDELHSEPFQDEQPSDLDDENDDEAIVQQDQIRYYESCPRLVEILNSCMSRPVKINVVDGQTYLWCEIIFTGKDYFVVSVNGIDSNFLIPYPQVAGISMDSTVRPDRKKGASLFGGTKITIQQPIKN